MYLKPRVSLVHHSVFSTRSDRRFFFLISLVSLLYVFFVYHHFIHTVEEKRLGTRTMFAFAYAVEYLKNGNLKANRKVYMELDSAFGSGSRKAGKTKQNLLLKADLLALGLQENEFIEPEDHQQALVILVLGVWKFFGVKNIDFFIKFMLFMHFLTCIGVYVVGFRMGGLTSGMGCLVSFLLFIPGLNFLLQGLVHWFVCPGMVLAVLMSTSFFRRPSMEIGLMVLGTISLALISKIRNGNELLLFVLLLFLMMRFGVSKKFLVNGCVIVVTFFAVSGTCNRFLVKAGGTPPYHQFWFPVYVGLAEIPDGFGGQYPRLVGQDEDHFGYEAIHRVDPSTAFGSPEGDLILRKKVLEILKSRPDLFVEMFSMRFVRILMSLRHDWKRFSFFPDKLLRALFPLFGLIGLFFIYFLPNTPSKSKNAKTIVSLIVLMGGIWMAQSIVILAKLPRYYIAWTFVYVFSFGYFIGVFVDWLIEKTRKINYIQHLTKQV